MSASLVLDYDQYNKFPDHANNEKSYVQYLSGTLAQVHLKKQGGGKGHSDSILVKEIQKARDQIKSSLNDGGAGAGSPDVTSRIEKLEKSNADLVKLVTSLQAQMKQLEQQLKSTSISPAAVANGSKATQPEEEDEEIDLFGSDDDDDAEQERIKEQRVQEYKDKKSKKPALIAKSNIILDVKPWDDETDMSEVERLVRSIKADGLLWGAGKLVAVGYGIKKLQIGCVVEDDKVGTDFLEEEITKFEDYVQSVDIAAFNKV